MKRVLGGQVQFFFSEVPVATLRERPATSTALPGTPSPRLKHPRPSGPAMSLAAAHARLFSVAHVASNEQKKRSGAIARPKEVDNTTKHGVARSEKSGRGCTSKYQCVVCSWIFRTSGQFVTTCSIFDTSPIRTVEQSHKTQAMEGEVCRLSTIFP